MLERKLDKLYDKDIEVVCGKVKGSSADFPYTEIRTSVQMHDPEAQDALNKLVSIKENRLTEVRELVVKIEEFIATIPDSETRQIFELTYIDGMSQSKVADEVEMERSNISKRISNYLNFHTFHRNK
ncbi:DUF1492 domain-containing protein [Lachnospiraceae bacterium LCP25S3_G4]